ncbi:MAG: transcriptional repressor [Pseudomonadota bacterium]
MKRKTQQREAIKRVFEEHERPLRVGEILELGRKEVPRLDQATVYRNLKRLVEQGWLLQITYPRMGTLYERAGQDHHHLFHCHECERVLVLPGCALDFERAAPPGFVTESHDIFLGGKCGDCSGSGHRKARRKKKAAA